MASFVQWQSLDFAEFTPALLYAVLRLREQVFVLEQHSLYGDLDGLDPGALHLLGRDGAGRLLAYARLLPPAGPAQPVSIGRVVVVADKRATGLGLQLMQQAMAEAEQRWPATELALSAQLASLGFYRRFGFEAVSEPYDDAGVMHVDMRLAIARA